MSPLPLLLRSALAVAALAAAALAQPAAPAPSLASPRPAPITAAPRQAWTFAEDGVTIDSQFAGARVSECTRLAPDHYAIVTRPENRPINGSPWFAFRVRATTARPITITLSCDGTRLRYLPKISVDGVRWITLPAEAFTPGPKPDEGTLRLDAGPEPVWVAAQEMITGEVLEGWSRTLERLPFVTRREIGRSVGGRPLHLLELNATPDPASASSKPEYVLVISRQHPPETTGSQALMRFIETVVADTPLARDFRRRFTLLLVPLMNPDGVEAGHWRHNLSGIDTNRDWAEFTQPETRAVRDAAVAAHARGRLHLALDFHSTFNDVFYTQADDAPSQPAGFTKAWLAGISRRVPAYEVKRSASPTPNPVTSAAWAHRTFGIPSVTYELGDNTDRVILQSVATAAAESMMEVLLAGLARESK